MKNTRSVRIAIGTVCLIAIALVMAGSWGATSRGRRTSPSPASAMGSIPKPGTLQARSWTSRPAPRLKARGITQGKAYNGRPEEIEQAIPPEIEEAWKEAGEWEYDAPDFDLSVRGIKVISTKSFADWYPEYAGTDYPAYDSSKLVAATVLVTNVSSRRRSTYSAISPCIISPYGARTSTTSTTAWRRREPGQRVLLRERVYRSEQDTVEPANRSRSSCVQGQQERLKDQSAFDNLDPSDFCLQLVDFDSGTAYRLWL